MAIVKHCCVCNHKAQATSACNANAAHAHPSGGFSASLAIVHHDNTSNLVAGNLTNPIATASSYAPRKCRAYNATMHVYCRDLQCSSSYTCRGYCHGH
jgi:hypothetical protein